MKKILLFVIAVLLIAGCTQSEKTTESSPYVGGSTGLAISFPADAPPTDIYDNGGYPFDIGLKLKNEGEYTIPNGEAQVKIKGIYYEDYGLSSTTDLVGTADEDILGTRKDADGKVVNGIETRVEFQNLNYQGNITGSMMPVNILAEACYLYETKAIANVCVREKLTTSKDGVCKVGEAKTAYNSGAPIHIENFLESGVSNNKFAFSFDVRHVATGKFFHPESECEENYQKENKVYLEVNTGFDGTVCSGLSDGTDTTGYVRVPEGKGSVRCTVTLSDSELGDYEKGISITAKYRYRDIIDKTITLKHSGE